MFNGVEDKPEPDPAKLNDVSEKSKKDKTKPVTNNTKGKRMRKKMKKKDLTVPKAIPTAVDPIPVMSKFKGPYVQLRQHLMSVVNFPINDDEVEKLQSKQKGFNKFLSHKNEKRHMRGMHASTLSIKYDDQTTDHTWICIFCKKGPHKDRMGDLYGPYIIDLGHETHEKGKKKKEATVPTPEHQIEMWTHETCATMTCGIYICGNKIIGLEEQAHFSQSQKCMYCELPGATIGCLKRGCKHIGHVICTKQNSWKICDNFQYYCKDHAS